MRKTTATTTTMRTRMRPAASDTLCPKVPGFLASRLAAEGFGSLLRGIDSKQVPYPLLDADPAEPQTCWATFLWVEDRPSNPASAVILSANAMVGQDQLERCEYEQVAEGLWAITLRVPSDWIASYRLSVHRGAGPAPWRATTDRRAIRLAADAGGIDRLNPAVGASMNGVPVSLVYGPAAAVEPRPAAATPVLDRPGPAIGGWGEADTTEAPLPERVDAHEVFDGNCGRMRRLWTYRPPVPARNTPLLVVHDGATWVRFQSIAASLDAAMESGLLPPLHALFVDSTNVSLRSAELPDAQGTTRSLAEQFLPWARELLPVSAAATQTVVTGSSFGGLAALLAVAHHPELVAVALAQSPSLWHTDLSGELASLDPRARVLLQAGRYETGIHRACAQAMDEVAGTQAAPRIGFQPISGGHDWAWWSAQLLPGLARLLNPQE